MPRKKADTKSKTTNKKTTSKKTKTSKTDSKTSNFKEADAKMNKNRAVLSYLWILCLVPLLSDRESEFEKFHARQGFILFVLSFATVVPFFGQILMLILVAVSVVGIFKVVDEDWWEIPYVHEWSKKIKF